MISVATLVIIMWDGVIKLYEAIILMVLFVTYLTILFCGKCFVRWYNKLAHLFTDKNGSTIFSEKKSKFYHWLFWNICFVQFSYTPFHEYNQSSQRLTQIISIQVAIWNSAPAFHMKSYFNLTYAFVVMEI